MTDDGEQGYWAARVPIEEFHDDYTLEVERLVVVRAADVADARRSSGFFDAEFHKASEDELAEWDEVLDEPFTERELLDVDRLVRKRLLDIASRIRRGAGKPAFAAQARDQALRLNRLRGKIEAELQHDEAA